MTSPGPSQTSAGRSVLCQTVSNPVNKKPHLTILVSAEYIESDKFFVSAHGNLLAIYYFLLQQFLCCKEWSWSGSCVCIPVARTVMMKNMFQYCWNLSPGHTSFILESRISFMFLRSLTATFSGKIEFSVVSGNGEKVFRKKKSIKESDTQIGRPMFGLLAAKFIPHKQERNLYNSIIWVLSIFIFCSM